MEQHGASTAEVRSSQYCRYYEDFAASHLLILQYCLKSQMSRSLESSKYKSGIFNLFTLMNWTRFPTRFCHPYPHHHLELIRYMSISVISTNCWFVHWNFQKSAILSQLVSNLTLTEKIKTNNGWFLEISMNKSAIRRYYWDCLISNKFLWIPHLAESKS